MNNAKIIFPELYKIIFFDDEIVYYQVDDGGLFHSDTLPSVIILLKNVHSTESFFSKHELYFEHGLLYKKDGPAEKFFYLMKRSEYDKEGEILKSNWYLEGKIINR